MYWTFCNYTWVISGQYVGHLVASVPFPLIEFLLWLEAMAGSAKQVTCCVFQPYLGHNLGWEEAGIIFLHKGNKKEYSLVGILCFLLNRERVTVLFHASSQGVQNIRQNSICWRLNVCLYVFFSHKKIKNGSLWVMAYRVFLFGLVWFVWLREGGIQNLLIGI